MQVKAIKTHKITEKDTDILKIIDKYIPRLAEKSIVVVTSKIVAICEGRVAQDTEGMRDALVEKEAAYYLPRHSHKYDFCISIKNNTFVATAGIDRSNANGKLVLWPKDPQKSANTIREHLIKKHKVKDVGVVITDSKTTPLRWGVTGTTLAASGFAVLKSYVGIPDVFGRPLHFEKLNIAEGLAASAVLTMGEGAEQTPLAVIHNIPYIEFQRRNPTKKELADLRIAIEDDVYYPLLTSVKWKKGKGK